MMLETFRDFVPFKRSKTKNVPAKEHGAHPVAHFHRDMNDLFSRFFEDDGFFSTPSTILGSKVSDWFGDFSPETFTPSVDIADEPKHLKITADVPGIESDDLKIDVHDKTLFIRGEKHLDESTEEDEGYYRTERAFGSFERTIPLPTKVDVDHAEATFKNGVLTVRLPKIPAEETKAKAIKVNKG